METWEVDNEADCKGEQRLLLKRTLETIHLPPMKSLLKNIKRVGQGRNSELSLCDDIYMYMSGTHLLHILNIVDVYFLTAK